MKPRSKKKRGQILTLPFIKLGSIVFNLLSFCSTSFRLSTQEFRHLSDRLFFGGPCVF